MDEEIVVKLEEKIQQVADGLNGLEPGSVEHQRCVEDYTKLYKTGLEERRCLTDYEDRISKLELEKEKLDAEKEAREKQEAEAKKEKMINFGFRAVEVGLTVAQLCLTCKWLSNGLKFEETGSFTSKSPMWLRSISNLFNKKK